MKAYNFHIETYIAISQTGRSSGSTLCFLLAYTK